MFRKLLPRTYELRDLAEASSSPDAYFQNFDTILKKYSMAFDSWKAWEKEFQGLDEAAWKFFKNEARPRLIQKDKLRGWVQLFDLFNQARAYNYLARIGCKEIHFIPRSRKRTPDIEAKMNSAAVLCEVKTINTSEEELRARRTSEARSISISLNDGFFAKLENDIEMAKKQIEDYDVSGEAKHFIYLDVCFDEWVGDCHA